MAPANTLLRTVMHELLDAIAQLFSVLLIPFTGETDPRKKWIKVVGLSIAAIGMIIFLSLLIWGFLAPAGSNL